MDLGIVTSQLSHYGGSEVYLLECLKRWQDDLNITLYTTRCSQTLLREFGIKRKVKLVRLPSGRNSRDALIYNTLVLPRLWENVVGRHDLYFLYLFPTQFINRHPSVWFAAEPFRMIYDLRQYGVTGQEANVHFYPKLQYDKVRVSELSIVLHLIEKIDSASTFDRLVTNSKATGHYLHSVYGRVPDRVIYPGVNMPPLVSPPPSSGPVLFVGTLWRHKRVDLIIKALSLLTRRKLVIVGEGPEKPFLQELVSKNGLNRRVTFRGKINQASLLDIYRECSVCVYTPVREPFGMVPLEAAAAGRPIVATEGGGYSEILDASCAKFIPADPEKIAGAIQAIVDDSALARKMGKAGRQIAAQYSWDRSAAMLLNLFRESARSRKYKKRASRGTLLGAHYYPWYRTGKYTEHWNENRGFAAVTDFPTVGPYSSDDAGLIRRHLNMALGAGIDFLVVNWQVTSQGLNPTELTATRKLFAAVNAGRYPLSLSILLALNTEDPRVIASAIQTVHSEFVPSSVYHRYRDRAVIWYYLSNPFLGYFFHNYHDLLEMNRACHSIATGQFAYDRFLPKLLRQFFSGWCLYSPLQVGRKNIRPSIWKRTYRDSCEDSSAIRTFTICPGYDDSCLTSPERKNSRYRITSRDNTRTYQQMQRIALELNPAADFIVVTSFNEFHENTHIEPSRMFGDVYLRSTCAFKNALSSWNNGSLETTDQVGDHPYSSPSGDRLVLS